MGRTAARKLVGRGQTAQYVAFCRKLKFRRSSVQGIGLSGQMHGLVMLDSSDRVIRPSLIWCDQRSQEQVDGINRLLGATTVLACTANPVLTGFTLAEASLGTR